MQHNLISLTHGNGAQTNIEVELLYSDLYGLSTGIQRQVHFEGLLKKSRFSTAPYGSTGVPNNTANWLCDGASSHLKLTLWKVKSLHDKIDTKNKIIFRETACLHKNNHNSLNWVYRFRTCVTISSITNWKIFKFRNDWN